MEKLVLCGSGKNSPAAVALHKVAQQNDHSAQALAQSMVASNSLSVFDKVVPNLESNNAANNTVNNYFKITPNPAANKAIISLSSTITKGKLLVYDTLGRLIEQKPIEQQLSLELSHYANEVYCIMLTDDKNIPVHTQKLVVVQ